jgi:hypothetical protein
MRMPKTKNAPGVKYTGRVLLAPFMIVISLAALWMSSGSG